MGGEGNWSNIHGRTGVQATSTWEGGLHGLGRGIGELEQSYMWGERGVEAVPMEWGWGYRKRNMYLVCFKRGYHLQLIKCWLLWTWALRPGWWYPSLLDNQVFAVKHLGKGNMQFGCRSLEVPAKRNKQTNRIKILQGFYDQQSLDLAYQPSAFRKLLKYGACHKIGWTYKLPNCKHRITGNIDISHLN